MTPSQFLEKVTCNDIEAVRAAITANPALVNASGWNIRTTALHAAAHRGFAPIVELLLANGANVHAREGASNTTPLHWAAEGGHHAIARLLVNKGAALEPLDDWYGLGPLGWAAVVNWAPQFHEDKPATAAYLLEAGATPDIFSAIVLNRPEDVRRIVTADSGQLSRRLGFVAAGMQPLHLAISRKLPDMVKLLLELGADVHSRTSSGVTPYALSLTKLDNQIVTALLERGATADISSAVLSGDLNLIAEKLKASPTDREQLTQLLFLSTGSGKAGIVELLLQHGADANARSRQLVREVPSSVTPLLVAAMNGAQACALALLKAGANPNPAIDGTPSPLHLAAGEGHLETARVLLQYGADRDAHDAEFNANPQSWAEFGGHQEVVELLKAKSLS